MGDERVRMLRRRNFTSKEAMAGLAAGLVGGALGAVVVIALDRGASVELGNLAEWGAAIGTVAALVYAGRALRHEKTVRLENEEERAAEAARSVHVGFAPSTGADDTGTNVRGTLIYQNLGVLPVRQAVVRAGVGNRVETVTCEELLPGKSYSSEVDFRFPLGELPGKPWADMSFTDSGGRRWLVIQDEGGEGWRRTG